MLTQDQMARLRAPFPKEALSADTSRGFELTSIRAAYVIERLNEVFGPCGAGWRYVHAPFEQLDGEVVTEVAVQYPVEGSNVPAVVWDAEAGNWGFLPDTSGWSWPILAVGGKKVGKGGAPLTDARKSAVTDGLTKAASMIGVGHEIFKGLVRLGRERKENSNSRPRKDKASRPMSGTDTEDSGSASAQSFWKLANEALDAGITHERIRAIASSANGNGWRAAMDTLRAEMKRAA